jgi:transcriptional regulator with XRE-family HTH domain
VKHPGPQTKREKLKVLGKYLDDAIQLAKSSQAELARKAELKDSSYISHVMKGERSVDRATLINWCQILNCPAWLEERILNSAGFATEQQILRASDPYLVEQTHQRVMQEVSQSSQLSKNEPSDQ